MEIKFSKNDVRLEKKLNRFAELIMITTGCSEETAKKCLERLMSNGLTLSNKKNLERVKERVFQDKINFNDFWIKYMLQSKNKEWSSIQKEFMDEYFKAMHNKKLKI